MPARLLRLQASPDLVERVHRTLLDAICDGTFAPGQRFTQEELAEQMNVSRQPVLQALRLLKKDGFVEDAPGRGLRVTDLSADWVHKVYQVRGALEALAANLAAQRRFRIDPKVIQRGRKAARNGDVMALIDADLAFHAAICEAADNPLITQSVQLHWHHLRRVMGAVLQQAGQRQSVWDEHTAIADAIAAGDSALASRLVVEHSARADESLGLQLETVLRRRASAAS